MWELLVIHGCAVVLAAVAAGWDYKTGHIPNWLTLPPLIIAPATYFALGGVPAFLDSFLGILVCGLVPLGLFYMKTPGGGGPPMHGGDVKLFAALGAILGWYMGVEAQFYSVFAAAIFVMGQMAWKGKLLQVLGNSAALVVNPILPKKRRREISPDLLHTIRLGPAIFVGTAVAVALRHSYLLSM